MSIVSNNPECLAKIEWRDGLPYSATYQDVYFSSDNGLQETEYVFLQGNKLLPRWQQLQQNKFTIIETGFGTGLNFLSAVKLWLESTQSNATLHYISVEKYPLSSSDITTALAYWPQLRNYRESLLSQYDQLIDSSAPLMMFNNRVQLNLLIGDATVSLGKINECADAWFLDGFSPSKNPDMWSPELLGQVAKLSKQNTTFATFTSAGLVKRSLVAAGFTVVKRSGFGKKREMLIGHYAAVDLLKTFDGA